MGSFKNSGVIGLNYIEIGILTYFIVPFLIWALY